MKSWPVQEAKARFSELLNACEREGPQIVTRRGEETAVLLPVEEWRRLTASRPSLKTLLLAPQARCDDLPLSKRGGGKHRAAPDF
jgi:prevent-host-death family protein